MAHWLRKLKLKELSFVDKPANQHARVVLFKRAEDAEGLATEIAKCYCCPENPSSYEAKSFGEIFANNVACDQRDKVWKEVGPAVYALECSLRTTAQDLAKSSDEKQALMTTAVGEFLNAVRGKWPDVEAALAKSFLKSDPDYDGDEDSADDPEDDDTEESEVTPDTEDSEDATMEAATARLNRKIKKLERLYKRQFSSEQRQRLADKGQAMPDGSFPIANVSDLHNAIRAIGRAKNPAAAKAHIKRRARALGATDALPESWNGGKSLLEKISALTQRTAAVQAQWEKFQSSRKS